MEPYQIIYADPPWRYDQKGVEGAAEQLDKEVYCIGGLNNACFVS